MTTTPSTVPTSTSRVGVDEDHGRVDEAGGDIAAGGGAAQDAERSVGVAAAEAEAAKEQGRRR